MPAALTEVEQILAYLATATLDGAYDPMLVYLVCYETLRAADDGRWRDVLHTAVNLIETRAAGIANERERHNYVTAVPSNRQLRAAAQTEAG